jgi:hypothetical protein
VSGSRFEPADSETSQKPCFLRWSYPAVRSGCYTFRDRTTPYLELKIQKLSSRRKVNKWVTTPSCDLRFLIKCGKLTARWQTYVVLSWGAMIGIRMTVKTEQLLQDGGPPEYVYHDRTEWRCAVFVGKRYGSKGYPQRNAAHVRWILPVTSSSP